MKLRQARLATTLMVLTCLAAVLPSAAFAATLHAIFVIDTNDQNIGDMVAKDLQIVGAEMQRVAQATGLSLNDKVIKGGDFTIENVKSVVQAASPAGDDVMFFYYSGHGFRTPTKTSDWPYFFFHSNRTIDFGWVVDTLNAKGARLTISLVDACNNVVDAQIREEQKGAGLKGAEGYKALFLGYEGTVAAASSVPGETSNATSSGSLFTLSFLSALADETNRAQPSWQSLMNKAAGSRISRQASNGREIAQTPFYKQSTKQVASAPPPTASTQPPPVTAQPPAPTVQPPAPTVQPPATPPAPPPPTASTQPPPVPPAPATPPQPASPYPDGPGGWMSITQ